MAQPLPYEWWKIKGFPAQTNKWHEADEWQMFRPKKPYLLQGGRWIYDPTISLRPTIEMNWQTDDAATTCHACPDNWASIPLPYICNDGSAAPCDDDNYAFQTGYAGYPGFQGKRQEQGNRNCLICPPGMDTGDANHLDLRINKVATATCPRSHPFAVSTGDSMPFYGRYCCKNNNTRINAYVQHASITDVCDDYIDCPSVFDDSMLQTL